VFLCRKINVFLRSFTKQFCNEADKKVKSNQTIKPQIMKKAILTIGLFTLVMGLTSFTTPEGKSKVEKGISLEVNGGQSAGGNKKVDVNGGQSAGGNKKVDVNGGQSAGGNKKVD
jgi:hypothetical protein